MSQYYRVAKRVSATDDDPGVALVNRYTELQTEIDGLQKQVGPLEEERHKIRNAIAAHAEQAGVDVVSGSDHEARITRHTDIVLPRKTEEFEQYKQLDKQLRSIEAWPSVSSLDISAIRRIWTGEAPDLGGVLEIIEPFVREEPDVQLRRRKKD